MPLYTYTQLDVANEEIRLIKLLPGSSNDDLSFSIYHAPLVPPKPRPETKRPSIEEVQQTLPEDWRIRETLNGRYLFTRTGTSGRPNSWTHPNENFNNGSIALPHRHQSSAFEPKFEALSYTWGPNTNSVVAHILDPSCSEQRQADIQIGANLACALKHLRYPDYSRTLWVDAICINQNDIDERNAQVKRMGFIYSLASRVVIWLGPEAEGSEHALSTVDHFGNQVEYLGDYFGDSPGATEVKWWNPAFELPWDEKTWFSLMDLFRRPWFSRVWVLQEALLATHQAVVQCGDTSYPWYTFRKAMLVLTGKKVGVPSELSSWLESYSTAFFAESLRSLPFLMRWASDRQSTDPRDRLYGMLTLLSPAFSERIEPQYSMPTHQIYMDAFLAHLDVEKRLSLLRQCSIEQRCGDWPSWVPNWAEHRAMRVLPRQASGLSAAQTQYLAPHTLQVLGTGCGRVSTVKNIVPADPVAIMQDVRRWLPEGHWTGDYISGSSFLDAFLEVVFLGRIRERYVRRGKEYPTLVEIRNDYLAMLSDTPSHGYGSKYLKGFSNLSHVSLFMTQEGFLGVGPPGTTEGRYMCPDP